MTLGGPQSKKRRPLFRSQTEAKTFFVDKIVVQARAEGQPLSDNEQWMLQFSEFDPDFIVDPERVAQLEAEISESAYKDKIVRFLQRSYQRDVRAAGTDARALYREASATLYQGDHYLLIMIDRALGSAAQGARPIWVRGLTGFVLFAVLVVPGTIASRPRQRPTTKRPEGARDPRGVSGAPRCRRQAGDLVERPESVSMTTLIPDSCMRVPRS
jgi:hypothetical protein